MEAIVLILLGMAAIGVGVKIVANNKPSKEQAVTFQPQSGAWQENQPPTIIESNHPAEPQGPASKGLWYAAAGGAFLVALLTLLTFSAVSILSPFFIWLGIVLIQVGSKADELHAKNMRFRADAEASHGNFERARIQTENARREAERQAQLNVLRDIAEKEKLEAERLAHIQMQRDITYQETLRPIAQKHGIDIRDVITLNVQKVQAQLELEKQAGQDNLDNQKRWEQLQQNLNAINLVKLADSEQMKQLTTILIQEVDNLVKVDSYKWPDEQKEIVRGQIKNNIKFYQEQINGIHTNSRFVQGGAREKSGGLGEGTSDTRNDYPPSDGDDEE